MWVILGHSTVLAKKSGQHVPGFKLGTLSWYALPLATRPPPPLWSEVWYSGIGEEKYLRGGLVVLRGIIVKFVKEVYAS